jgi:hypothetical protein
MEIQIPVKGAGVLLKYLVNYSFNIWFHCFSDRYDSMLQIGMNSLLLIFYPGNLSCTSLQLLRFCFPGTFLQFTETVKQ